MRNYMRDHRHLLGKSKQQDIFEIMEDIKSFKSMLPNSVKDIPMMDSEHSIG